MQVAFHIEPFENRRAETIKAAIKYIVDTYGKHNAFYRKKSRGRHLPLFYMYDSYQIKEKEWKKLFSRLESETVRETAYDALFIGMYAFVRIDCEFIYFRCLFLRQTYNAHIAKAP